MVNGIAIRNSAIKDHICDNGTRRFVDMPDHDGTTGQATAKDKKSHEYKCDHVPV